MSQIVRKPSFFIKDILSPSLSNATSKDASANKTPNQGQLTPSEQNGDANKTPRLSVLTPLSRTDEDSVVKNPAIRLVTPRAICCTSLSGLPRPACTYPPPGECCTSLPGLHRPACTHPSPGDCCIPRLVQSPVFMPRIKANYILQAGKIR